MKRYTQEQLNLSARISLQLGENLHVDEFAVAIAIILKSDYGEHNYNTFTQTLNNNLYGN
jgi:hypothetical protein